MTRRARALSLFRKRYYSPRMVALRLSWLTADAQALGMYGVLEDYAPGIGRSLFEDNASTLGLIDLLSPTRPRELQ